MKDSRIRHETQQPSSWRRGTPTRQNIFRCLLGAMLSISIAGCATVRAEDRDAQPVALLDQIWQPLPPLKRVLSKQDQEYAEAALTQWLLTYLRGNYEVVDQGFFWDSRKYSTWGPMNKGYAAHIGGEDSHWYGMEIDEDWYTPATDPIRLWKVSADGKDHYLAIAMTDQPVPGTRGRNLIGRFELKKSD